MIETKTDCPYCNGRGVVYGHELCPVDNCVRGRITKPWMGRLAWLAFWLVFASGLIVSLLLH